MAFYNSCRFALNYGGAHYCKERWTREPLSDPQRLELGCDVDYSKPEHPVRPCPNKQIVNWRPPSPDEEA